MEEEANDIALMLPATNYFTYKDKKYPFNFDLFKLFAKSFSSDQFTLLPNLCVNIIDESEDQITLSDESILYFIRYCQNQGIQKQNLTNENILSLNFLSKKYEVQSLIDLTEKYISQHQDDFVLYFLTKDDLGHLNSETFESILSDKLINYINDPQLLSLSIPVLNRVLTKYQLKYKQQNQTEIIDFLFKCLDKYGQSASVLFSNIDLSIEKTEYFNRLLNDYSDIFDFHFNKGKN